MIDPTIEASIENHIADYRSKLRDQESVAISELISSHIQMKPLLHEKASEESVDTSAFIYSILRLPECISHVGRILLAQSYTVFKKQGYAAIEEWQTVSSPGRRRKMVYDGDKTLAVYVASVSDVDDVISLLTAYQIEWNKFHRLLQTNAIDSILSTDDKERLQTIVGERFPLFIEAIKRHNLSFNVQLLSGSYIEYSRTTQMWWNHIVESVVGMGIHTRPLYFVSSNTHSLQNLITNTAVTHEDELIQFIDTSGDTVLQSLWKDISLGTSGRDKEYFLHYVAKKYERINVDFRLKKESAEKDAGIITINPYHYLDVPAQIIEVKRLAGRRIHSSLAIDTSKLSNSEAIIVNIDYPLGWAAYQILSEISQNAEYLSGIYIMGKAAILHGEIGDVVVPTEIYDTHSRNTYTFNNILTKESISRYVKTGSVFENEKNITVKGTFFENQQLLEEWQKEGYTTIEMEGGPYLNALSENVFYSRYRRNQNIQIPTLPFDFGMAYYASDTPNSKAKNLGSRNLSYDGIECTYGITLSILERILQKESES